MTKFRNLTNLSLFCLRHFCSSLNVVMRHYITFTRNTYILQTKPVPVHKVDKPPKCTPSQPRSSASAEMCFSQPQLSSYQKSQVLPSSWKGSNVKGCYCYEKKGHLNCTNAASWSPPPLIWKESFGALIWLCMNDSF